MLVPGGFSDLMYITTIGLLIRKKILEFRSMQEKIKKFHFYAPIKVRLAFSICIGVKPVKRHFANRVAYSS